VLAADVSPWPTPRLAKQLKTLGCEVQRQHVIFTYMHGVLKAAEMSHTWSKDDMGFCIIVSPRLQLILPWDGNLRTALGHCYR
jgi:hypothetical protein